METATDKVTRLPRDWGHGDLRALEQLVPLIYNELRHLAPNFLYRERRPCGGY